MILKTYRATRDPNVFYSVTDGNWFPCEKGHPQFVEMEKLKAAGEAEIQPFVEPTAAERRRSAYAATGISGEKMIVALWEMVVEGRHDAVTAIQEQRDAIKSEHPKE